jgi:hypothetical protein
MLFISFLFTISGGKERLLNMISRKEGKRGNSSWYFLLIIPFIGTLWPPFYSSIEPRFIGIPFFYWYQFLWVIISAVLTAIVYYATKLNE